MKGTVEVDGDGSQEEAVASRKHHMVWLCTALPWIVAPMFWGGGRGG